VIRTRFNASATTSDVFNPHTQATCDREFHAHRHPIGAQPKRVRPSIELRKVAKFRHDITSDGPASDVAVSQFPPTLTDRDGTFTKPASW
jgi:hypothetical protein